MTDITDSESVSKNRSKQDETPKFSPCQKCCCNAETNQIDCTYSNLETIPENAHYMTHIYLDYNQISNIKGKELKK